VPSLGKHRVDTTRVYTLVLRDSKGEPVDLSDVDSVAAVLVPYPGEPSVATLAASVQLPAEDGIVTVAVPSSQVVDLPTGEYTVLVTPTIGGVPTDAAADYTIELAGGDGTTLPDGPVAASERAIVADMGPLLKKVGLSCATNGRNRDFDAPFSWAFTKVAFAGPSNGIRPTDAELLSVSAKVHDFIDLATYRLLLSCRNRWTQVTTRTSTGQINSTELRQDLEKRIEAMEAMPVVKRALGMGLSGGGVELTGLYERDWLSRYESFWGGCGPS
jgi:hypothetical protein